MQIHNPEGIEFELGENVKFNTQDWSGKGTVVKQEECGCVEIWTDEGTVLFSVDQLEKINEDS